jgi:hypothetical protein
MYLQNVFEDLLRSFQNYGGGDSDPSEFVKAYFSGKDMCAKKKTKERKTVPRHNHGFNEVSSDCELCLTHGQPFEIPVYTLHK